MSQRRVTRELAQYIVDLRYEDLSPGAIQATKEALLDQVGVMLMGSTLPWTQFSRQLVTGLGGNPEATIVNYGTRVPAVEAAFVNGNFGHGCELDDLGYAVGAHPGALIFPSAFAVAERDHLSGQRFLLASVVGYEVLSRLGKLMGAKVLDRGFHHQSVLGPPGVAAATGKLLGLDAERMVHALSIAGSHSCGTMEYDQGGGEAKRVHNSIAVRGGMVATMLAQLGLTGPEAILEGKRGICWMFGGVGDASPIVEDLPTSPDAWYAIQGRGFKKYPAVGTVHTSIQALERLRKEHQIEAAQVQRIDVWANELVVLHGGAIYHPHDALSAQFSLPFSLGLLLIKGSNDLRNYLDPSLWHDPDILAAGEKVHVHPDPQMMRLNGGWGARVSVELTDGSRVEAEELYNKGTMHNPLTPDELREKFENLASAVLDAATIQRVQQIIGSIEEVEDVAGVLPLLVKPAQR